MIIFTGLLILFIFRHKVKAFDDFLNRLVTKNKSPLLPHNPEILKEMIEQLKILSLEDKLILLQHIVQRDIRVIMAIDDRAYWFEAFGGHEFE